MQIVWSQNSPSSIDEEIQPFSGRYQDLLRSVGAWLDARGYQLARLSESGDSLVIEVEAGVQGDDHTREVLRLDIDALDRLSTAARNDRNRFLQAG